MAIATSTPPGTGRALTLTPKRFTHQASWDLTSWCCCTGSQARLRTGCRWPDGCLPSSTPSRRTGRDMAPARWPPADSPRTRALLDDLDARGVRHAVLVGHSYGGGVALSAASLAPDRVEAVILLASVGPGCVNGWDRLLAAPGVGPLCALMAWRLTPWIARARLRWAAAGGAARLAPVSTSTGKCGAKRAVTVARVRTFLLEQRALLQELPELEQAVPSVQPRCCCSPTPGPPDPGRYRPRAGRGAAGRASAAH